MNKAKIVIIIIFGFLILANVYFVIHNTEQFIETSLTFIYWFLPITIIAIIGSVIIAMCTMRLGMANHGYNMEENIK